MNVIAGARPSATSGAWRAFATPLFVRTALAIVLLGSLAARLAPLATFAVWGSDTGEYVFLTERLVAEGAHRFDYDGWGIVYPYFPGFYVLAGAIASATGIETSLAVHLLGPALGALAVYGVFLIARAVTGDPLLALAASAIVGLAGPHVIVTSHAMPGTLGHVLALLAILAILRAYEDRKFAVPLALAGVAILATHHLSTYFLVGAVAAVAFLREFGAPRSSRRRLAIEIPFVVALASAAAALWLSVPTFRERIVADVFDTNAYVAAAGFVAILAALPAAVIARRRFLSDFTHHPRLPSPRTWALASGATLLVPVAATIVFMGTAVPGTAIAATPETVLYAAPVFAALALAGLGGAYLMFHREGLAIVSWAAAIAGSLVLAAATANEVLPAYRHVEYLLEPLAILAAAGWIAAWRWAATAAPSRRREIGRIAAMTAVVLVLSLAMTSQPPREAVGGFEEGVTHAELAAIRWVRDHPDVVPPGSVVAADHRLSSLLFGVAGMRATWDYAIETFHAPTYEAARKEMSSVDLPSGNAQTVQFVMLSPVTREGVIVGQFATARPMSDAAWAKFFIDERYVEVYREPGVAPGENGVYLFRVNGP